MVVQRDCDKFVTTLKQELDWFLTFLCGEDGFAQDRGSVLLIVDGLQLHIRRDASFESQTVPPNLINAAMGIRAADV